MYVTKRTFIVILSTLILKANAEKNDTEITQSDSNVGKNSSITTSTTLITIPVTPATIANDTSSTAPPTKTTVTPVPTTTVTNKPTTTANASVTTTSPNTTEVPHHSRQFDGPSFIGGIVLASGLMAIGFVAFKFYKARTERNYHTL